MKPNKVIILGGGVAGMSAAHELIHRHFQVEVYEAKELFGGKAKSVDVIQDDGTRLPGEHGFRFFPGFYKHIIQTLKEIPYDDTGTRVFDMLTPCPQGMIARNNSAPLCFITHFPGSFKEVKQLLQFRKDLSKSLNPGEGKFFMSKLWELLSSCKKRKDCEVEKRSWWDFIKAEEKGEQYQTLCATGLTRTLVAANAKKVSAKTGGNVVVRFLCDILKPRCVPDRVLMGPTSEVWINPWKKHLEKEGVVFKSGYEVSRIHRTNDRVTSVDFKNGERIDDADACYILALPVEDAELVISDHLKSADDSFSHLNHLTKCVRWMTGVQLYVNQDLPVCAGHVIYADSDWAITSISQIQFWKKNGYKISAQGNGKVKEIISADVSDWFNKSSVLKKEARECVEREEIAKEVMRQITESLCNMDKDFCLTFPGNVEQYYVDRSIISPKANSFRPPVHKIQQKFSGQQSNMEYKTLNEDPLLVNEQNTWRLRPDAITKIPNFFLAADYVRTNTDLATMEAANEAARRAVNGILKFTNSCERHCRIWKMYRPFLFFPFRWMDSIRYRMGKPYSAKWTMCGGLIALPFFLGYLFYIIGYFFVNMIMQKFSKK